MKENIGSIKILLVVFFFLIIFLLFFFAKKIYDWCLYIQDYNDYNAEEIIDEKYDLFQKHEKEFNEMIIELEKYEISKISKESSILNEDPYKEFKRDEVYIYSIINNLDLSQLTEEINFFKKSDLDQIYLYCGEYYFLFSTSKNYSLMFVYSREISHLEDCKKEVRKGNMVRFSITKKINDNWALMFSNLPL